MNTFRSALSTVALLVGLALPAAAQDLSTLTQLLSTLGGEQKSVAAIGEGKVTVVSFWATWCKPCKEEMRAMDPLYQRMKGQVEYIAVSIDDTKTMSRVAPFISSKGYTFTILLDPNRELFKALNGTDVPYTLVYGTDGKLRSKHDGFLAGDEAKMEAELKSLLPTQTGETPAETAAPAEDGVEVQVSTATGEAGTAGQTVPDETSTAR